MATAWTGGAERFRAAFGTRQMTKTPTGGPARRTSESHPLQIASLPVRDGYGRIGITLCPGKQQAHASTGAWSRDLSLDLDAIVAWNTAAVVTLVETHELERLKVWGGRRQALGVFIVYPLFLFSERHIRPHHKVTNYPGKRLKSVVLGSVTHNTACNPPPQGRAGLQRTSKGFPAPPRGAESWSLWLANNWGGRVSRDFAVILWDVVG